VALPAALPTSPSAAGAAPIDLENSRRISTWRVSIAQGATILEGPPGVRGAINIAVIGAQNHFGYGYRRIHRPGVSS
jgi:hypothetical protein